MMKNEIKNMPLISIIVPVYNVEKYLKRCFDSIKKQTYTNIEIILIDDGSQDCSGKLCDELVSTDDRARVIHKVNGGLSSARNAGIDVARGEYIGFVDSDDWIDSKMYELLYLAIKKSNSKISCCGRFDVDAETGSETVGLCPRKEEVVNSEECLDRMLRWNNIDSSAVDKLFHRSAFEEFKFPVGVISEDVAVMYRVISWSGRISLVPVPMYYYFHRKNSITTSAFSERKLDVLKHSYSILEFVRRHYPRIEQAALYFRYTQLMYVYDEIVESRAYTSTRYKTVMFQIVKEIKKYKVQMRKELPDTLILKMKREMRLFPNLYIILKKLKGKF